MIRSQGDTGAKGGQKVSSSASPLSRASCELRPGCLELCSVRAWKSPRMEPRQPCWEPVLLSSPVPQGERVSSSLFWPSLLSVLSSCYALLWRAWLQLFSHFPVSVGECWESPSPLSHQAIASSDWISQAPPASAHKANAPALWASQGLSSELTPVYHCLSCLGGPKLDAVF